MARLVHVSSGAVVEVADEKVARMGSEWEPEKAKSTTAKKSTAKKTAAKSADKS
jgi:topoisomerase IA-like protein